MSVNGGELPLGAAEGRWEAGGVVEQLPAGLRGARALRTRAGAGGLLLLVPGEPGGPKTRPEAELPPEPAAAVVTPTAPTIPTRGARGRWARTGGRYSPPSHSRKSPTYVIAA